MAVLDRLLGGLMDGNTRADAIVEQLRSWRADLTETFLVRLFAQLRRWRVISFRDVR
jgi:hypothetical protein